MQIFCSQVWLILLIVAMSSNLSFADIMDRRQDNIGVQEIYGSYGHQPFVTGTLNKSPNFVEDHCVGSEVFGDWALEFDISQLRNSFANFDVNNIYIDGYDKSGERALNIMQDVSRVDNKTQRLMSLQHGHWSGNKVSFCVGTRVRLSTTDNTLENKIYLWYNGSGKRTLHNVSSSDICNASGTNWLQKILGRAQADLVNSFCGNSNNKASVTFDTQNGTATLTSKVPLKSNGAKSLTISFSQAGVSSAQVKIFSSF